MEGSELLKSLTKEERREILFLLRHGEDLYGKSVISQKLFDLVKNAPSIKEDASIDEKQ